MIIGATLCMTIGLAGCASIGGSSGTSFHYKNITVADGSAMLVKAIRSSSREALWPSREPALKSATLCGRRKLTQTDLSLIDITDTKGKGKVRIISVVPSLDTPVCEQQTHYLSEKNKGLDKMVELVTVSIDTPFAQKRFAEEAKIANVTFLSDYRDAEFGKTYGLFLKGPHILARTSHGRRRAQYRAVSSSHARTDPTAGLG